MSKNRHPATNGEKSGGHRTILKACDAALITVSNQELFALTPHAQRERERERERGEERRGEDRLRYVKKQLVIYKPPPLSKLVIYKHGSLFLRSPPHSSEKNADWKHVSDTI